MAVAAVDEVIRNWPIKQHLQWLRSAEKADW